MRINTLMARWLVTALCAAAIGCAGSPPPSLPEQPAAANSETDRIAKSAFDGQRAFEHVRKQVDFGPRPSGSPAIGETRAYLKGQFERFGLKVTEDSFTATTPSPKAPKLPMTNLIAELPGQSDDIIIIASHYDTKYFENFRFVGANDGGSSTGVVLELANVLAKMKPADRKIPQTIWFVLFDGEEARVDWTDTDSTYGSRHLVEKLRETGKLQKVKAMLLLDMIGDKNLVVPRESQSAAWIVEAVGEAARELGYARHFPRAVHDIADDHLPFLKAGIPAADFIDFDYGPDHAYWHTAEDTLDKISPESLKIVGDTIIRALPRIAAQAR